MRKSQIRKSFKVVNSLDGLHRRSGRDASLTGDVFAMALVQQRSHDPSLPPAGRKPSQSFARRCGSVRADLDSFIISRGRVEATQQPIGATSPKQMIRGSFAVLC